MTSLQYHRPQSLDEALELLKAGQPLAGGTRLTSNMRGIAALVDLQDLGLDQVAATDQTLTLGGTTTLQNLVDHSTSLPEALVRAARLEAGWNIRNRATVAGTVVSGDGRSPLLTVLLALGAELEFAPDHDRISLEDAFEREGGRSGGKLITAIHATNSSQVSYEQVARSPADRPLLCVSIDQAQTPIRIALGGYGNHPQLVVPAKAEEAPQMARAMLENAGDQWASADYRADAAATLVARLINEEGEK